MPKPNKVVIGGLPIGDGHPAILMAEVGTFFNQDLSLAEEYLRKISEAGAPIFKTEILHDPNICLKDTGLEHRYQHAKGESVEDYRALIERKIVPLEGYARLFEISRRIKMPFVASVYDRVGIDFLVDQGAAAIKIARNNIDNVPLIRHAAGSGLPLILDTGHVSLDELDFAVGIVRDTCTGGIIINLHPGSNPAPASDHNLRAIEMLKSRYDCPVGLSCHYRGEELLYTAVGCGANLLEKGVDHNPDRAEQDLVSALSLSNVEAVVRRVHSSWEALGSTEMLVPEGRDLSARSGITAARDLPMGHRLTEEDLEFAWPSIGVSVRHWDSVVGRRISRDTSVGEAIKWDSVDES